MLRTCSLALVAAISLASAAAAQEVVVVTAQKQQTSADFGAPHVTLKRRADNVITEIQVVCDTRDPTQRDAELRQTLKNLIAGAAASNGAVALSIGDGILVSFNETMFDKVVTPVPDKAETSQATIVVKTTVGAGDTFDSATARIKSFVDGTEKAGRTEVLLSGSWNLSLVDPERSRPDLIKMIAEDARQTGAAFGEDYDIELAGLQQPVEWFQSDQLDLSLYIPYALVVKAPQP